MWQGLEATGYELVAKSGRINYRRRIAPEVRTLTLALALALTLARTLTLTLPLTLTLTLALTLTQPCSSGVGLARFESSALQPRREAWGFCTPSPAARA